MLPKVPKQYLAQTEYLFHCHIKVKIPIEFGEGLLDECFELFKLIDKKYNSYQEGSFFHQINKQAGEWVKVDRECTNMLRTILQVSQLTGGAYDITCMPLLKLWGFYRKENDLIPTSDQIKKCLKCVDYKTIFIKDDRIKINKGQEIVTGSFIKSYATDKVIELLKSKGVNDVIINAGGSTIVSLTDPSHTSWVVNIPNPFEEDEVLEKIVLSNQCFSLSGRSNSYLMIDGKRYGHILNCLTGYPSSTMQVGVLASSALIADILSTALCSLDKDEFAYTLKNLELKFDFSYFRIEENKKIDSNHAFDSIKKKYN